MANTLTSAEKYTQLLDEAMKYNMLTTDLESSQVQFDGGATVKIYKITGMPSSMSAYSRDTGFANHDITGAWESWTLTQDKGDQFQVDAEDNEESLDNAFSGVVGEYVKNVSSPEVDKYRLGVLKTKAGASQAGETINSAATALTAVEAGETALDEAEAPREGRILYITPSAYRYLRSGAVTRFATMTDTQINRDLTTFDGMKVVVTPSTRLGENVNFIIAHPVACEAVVKTAKLRIFSPEVNQEKDAWKFQYRIYHDCFVYDNKVGAIYYSTAA